MCIACCWEHIIDFWHRCFGIDLLGCKWCLLISALLVKMNDSRYIWASHSHHRWHFLNYKMICYQYALVQAGLIWFYDWNKANYTITHPNWIYREVKKTIIQKQQIDNTKTCQTQNNIDKVQSQPIRKTTFLLLPIECAVAMKKRKREDVRVRCKFSK